MANNVSAEDSAHVLKLFPEIDLISDEKIREGVVTAWAKAWRQGGWDWLEDAPLMDREIHDPEVGIQHVRVSTLLVIAIADILEREMGQTFNRDYLIAGAILHDVGKPLEYAPCGQGPLSGSALRHPVTGVHLVLDAGLALEIAHIVGTHSKEGMYQEKSLEAEIVTRADLLAWEVTCRQILGVSGSHYAEKFSSTLGKSRSK